jgi:hypothetical protein
MLMKAAETTLLEALAHAFSACVAPERARGVPIFSAEDRDTAPNFRRFLAF